MEPALYFYPYSRSVFHDRFHVPADFLTKDQRELIESKGVSPTDDEGHNGCYILDTRDFPSIFYRNRLVPLHGSHNIPMFLASLLCMPKGRTYCDLLENRVYPEYYERGKTILDLYRTDIHAATMLAQDIKNFPIERFYERFLQQQIPVTIDEKTSEQTIAFVEFDPHKIVFSADSMKEHGNDIDWFTAVYLHEWYHIIEQDLGSFVESTFHNHPRWRIRRKRESLYPLFKKSTKSIDKKDVANTFDVEWECENRKIKDGFYLEFAELLAELTYAKYPEVVERVRPIHAQLLGRKGFQRHLFLSHT